ncbi:hypothetical protein FACS18948_4900 [Clostridia bacterium]|nr:hypothetical protein FACS18948_4900 [Clostridia bacterium]
MQSLSDATLRFGEQLASITLGIDVLYRAEPSVADDTDGLAVINMGWEQITRLTDYREARERLAELAKLSFSLPEPDRRLYMLQACLSLDSFCAFRLGQLPSLETQVGMFLHVDNAPVTVAELDEMCGSLRVLLTQLGYSGDLAEQARQWEEKNRVPADEVAGEMNRLMAVARERCGEILELPDALYSCEVQKGGAFSARSEYDRLCVLVNIEPTYTLPALKHLVCHEVYPGHYLQFTYRKELNKKGFASADGLLSVVNHASSATFEGIADMGVHFLDWEESDDDRVSKLLSEIKSATGTACASQLHTLGWSKERILAWLRPYMLVGGEGALRSRMRFIEDPARAALIWSYWRGDQETERVYQRVEKSDLPRFYDYIYGRLHTPASMQLFR